MPKHPVDGFPVRKVVRVAALAFGRRMEEDKGHELDMHDRDKQPDYW